MGYSSYYQLVLELNLIGLVCSQLFSCVGLVMYKSNDQCIMEPTIFDQPETKNLGLP